MADRIFPNRVQEEALDSDLVFQGIDWDNFNERLAKAKEPKKMDDETKKMLEELGDKKKPSKKDRDDLSDVPEQLREHVKKKKKHHDDEDDEDMDDEDMDDEDMDDEDMDDEDMDDEDMDDEEDMQDETGEVEVVEDEESDDEGHDEDKMVVAKKCGYCGSYMKAESTTPEFDQWLESVRSIINPHVNQKLNGDILNEGAIPPQLKKYVMAKKKKGKKNNKEMNKSKKSGCGCCDKCKCGETKMKVMDKKSSKNANKKAPKMSWKKSPKK